MTTCTAKIIVWYTQEALITTKRVRKSISSTESFRSSYDSLSTSFSASQSGSIGFEGIEASSSGALSGLFTKVCTETHYHSEYYEKFESDEVSYHKDFLQLLRHERKEASIDGHSGYIEEAKIVQSVPTHCPKSMEDLQKLSEHYIKTMYRNVKGSGLVIGPKCSYEDRWTVDTIEPCAYKFCTGGGWIARPVTSKGWPAGNTGSSAQRHWLVSDRDGRRTCLEELENNDVVRIQTESTTDSGHDMMYASKKGWIYYDVRSGNPKQRWKVKKNSNTNVVFENMYHRCYYLGTYGGWLAIGGGRTAWAATPCR